MINGVLEGKQYLGISGGGTDIWGRGIQQGDLTPIKNVCVCACAHVQFYRPKAFPWNLVYILSVSRLRSADLVQSGVEEDRVSGHLRCSYRAWQHCVLTPLKTANMWHERISPNCIFATCGHELVTSVISSNTYVWIVGACRSQGNHSFFAESFCAGVQPRLGVRS